MLQGSAALSEGGWGGGGGHGRVKGRLSRKSAQLTLTSSGVVLDVLLHLAPEVLLVSQVMFCSVDVQRVIKVE